MSVFENREGWWIADESGQRVAGPYMNEQLARLQEENMKRKEEWKSSPIGTEDEFQKKYGGGFGPA